MPDSKLIRLEQEIVDIRRRLANTVTVGVIVDTNYSEGMARVRIGNIVTSFLPWAESRAGFDKTWEGLEIGEQVLVFSPSGELNNGIIMGSINSNNFPIPLATPSENQSVTVRGDGAVFSYDREQHALFTGLPDGATTVLISTGGVLIRGDTVVDGNLRVTGDVMVDGSEVIQGDLGVGGSGQVNGDLQVLGTAINGGLIVTGAAGGVASFNGTIEIEAGDVIADGISLKTHTHQENGSGGGTTSPPN